MHDPFVGAWKLNVSRSEFDVNHRPSEATMRWELADDGAYMLLAEGVDAAGRRNAEKPQRLVPDGKPYAVENLPGLRCITTRPEPSSIRAEAQREDGSLAGEGTYVVASDGRSMTATTAGFDSQLRPFRMRTVWDRL